MTPNGEVYEINPQPVSPGSEFVALLGRVKDGEVAEQAGDAMQELVRAVRSSKKGGSISLTVKIAPIKGNGDTVSFEVVVARKIPTPAVSAAFFYTGEEGTLHTSNPSQMKMFPKRVPSPQQAEERGE